METEPGAVSRDLFVMNITYQVGVLEFPPVASVWLVTIFDTISDLIFSVFRNLKSCMTVVLVVS